MTTSIHLDILTRLVMLLILVGLALYGYAHAEDIGTALRERLINATNISSTTTR